MYSYRLRQIMKQREKKVKTDLAVARRNSVKNDVIIEESYLEVSPTPEKESE